MNFEYIHLALLRLNNWLDYNQYVLFQENHWNDFLINNVKHEIPDTVLSLQISKEQK